MTTTTGVQSVASDAMADQERAVATLTTAFSSDPVLRWVFPTPSEFLAYYPRVVRAFAGGAFANGTAHYADDFGGVAMWLPPGAGSDEEATGQLLEEGVVDARKEDVFGFLGQMGEYHPTDTHWYLPFIGVDPPRQGRGLGSRLLGHALAECDAQRLPAYLEASTERNKALYERHGFEEIGLIQVGSSPPMWPMLRTPR